MAQNPAYFFTRSTMAYVKPKVGEMLYANRNGVGVYLDPSTTAPRSQSNSEHNHQQRDYESGQAIGTLIDDHVYPSPDGGSFYKVRNWIWIFVDDSVIKFGLVGHNEQEFHEAYVNVDDEPDGWIRETFRRSDLTRTEQKDKAAEIEIAIKGLPGIPQPAKVEKFTDANGKVSWIVTWANGYSKDFDEFMLLTPATMLTLTTRPAGKPAVNPNGLTDGAGTTAPKSTLFTTTNYLIAGGIVLLFSALLFVLLRKKK